MVAATLTTYYDSLVDLLEKNNDKNAKNKLEIPFETVAIPEIKTMELDNTYQNLIIEINDFSLSYNDVGIGIIQIIFIQLEV